ncbi:MAG: type II toxin-antitoxin system HicB family antitoxin [Desulfococcaceae bacterium]|nr:type II toxin-antitoxin system HicB family antitoxin [Desulfococcaceae bacterium]
MEIQLTAIFEKVKNGYIAYVEELPGANTQGTTLEEAKENLREAVQMVLEANKLLYEEGIREREIIREPFGLLTV